MSEPMPDTRWDLQKAQTLAPVIQETRALKTALAIRNHNREVRARELGLGDPYADDEFFGIDLAEYDTPDRKAEDQAMINERIDARIAPYEAVYVMSPNTFAALPTDEFMDAAQRINGLKMKIERRQSEQVPDTFNLDDMALFTMMAIGYTENRRDYEASPHVLEKAFSLTETTEEDSPASTSSFDTDLAAVALETAGLSQRETVLANANFVLDQIIHDGENPEELERQLAELLSQYGVENRS